MKKYVAAFVAAMLITLCVAMLPFAIGINAFFNKNTASLQDAPAADNTSDPAAAAPDQLAQLQNLVAQYQQREQQYLQREQQYQQRESQYQAQINAVQQQLDQVNATLGQYQQLIVYMQNLGLIQVDNSGRVSILSR
jgi:hypothetical protein